MKRPVGSILLGLFLLSQIVLQGGRIWPALPVIGSSQAAPAWTPVIPTRAHVVLSLSSGLVLQGSNGAFWRLHLAGTPHAEPVSTRTVDQLLPGGIPVRVHLARLNGVLRIVSVEGAPAWPSPDGRAVAVYDRIDGALWAMLSTDVRPRPLGSTSDSRHPALVWSAQGDRLAYLSGSPRHLWAWKVGTYASELNGAQGRPVAVRRDGTLVLAGGSGDPTMYMPGVGASVPVAAGRVLAASPYGNEALLAHAGRVFLTDLDNGDALPLPLSPAEIGQTAWEPGGELAVVRHGGDRKGILVAALTPAGAHWVYFPKGLTLAPNGLIAMRSGRVVCVLESAAGADVTYVRNLGNHLA